jgi:hypothetical protein
MGVDAYLVTGRNARVTFRLPKARESERMIIEVVDEVVLRGGGWQVIRRWNGDQFDWGLNSPSGTRSCASSWRPTERRDWAQRRHEEGLTPPAA